MMLAAATIVRRRAKQIPRAFTLALVSIFIGAGSVLALMIAAGSDSAEDHDACSGGEHGDRQDDEYAVGFSGPLSRRDHAAMWAKIESALALGATPDVACHALSSRGLQGEPDSLHRQRAVAGHRVDSGDHGGMVLSGASPVYAALYQFVVHHHYFFGGRP